MADETNSSPPAGDTSSEGTPPQGGQSNPFGTSGEVPSGSAALGPYGEGGSSPYAAYSSPYGPSSGGATPSAEGADQQVTDVSHGYGQSSAESYGQSSAGMYGQTSAPQYGQQYGSYSQTSASQYHGQSSTPYGQTDALARGAYPGAQTSSTSPYEAPTTASPYGQPADQSPYAQPGAAPYGQQLPGQHMPGAYPQGEPYPAQAYTAQPYTPAPPPGSSTFNVLGLISLIVGIFGLLVVIFGAAAIFFGLIGVVLGVLGLILPKFNRSKGLAIAGTIVSALALAGGVISLILALVISSSISSTADDFDSATYPVEVVMTVTSSGTSPVDIDYNVDNGVSGVNAFDVSDALFAEATPWENSMAFNINDTYDYSSVSMDVDASNYDDTVSCEITINDKVVAQDSGPGFAFCSVYGIYAYLSGSTTAP